ncbi:hypothetical protein Clacol_004038 [Clathrus columnatus]|uniref:Uncharacterized protein n=1 Tax=Clathrus columnatus TaxID=1419009 RepID=A0AAV5A9B7_9AGAM|nr:hypothetical protein Clacol_004038 [Clathrus columnatus]
MNVSTSLYKPSDILSTLAKALPKQQFNHLLQKEISPILDKLPIKQQEELWNSICSGLPAQLQLNGELSKIADVRVFAFFPPTGLPLTQASTQLAPFLAFKYKIQFQTYLGIVKSYPTFNDALLSITQEAVFRGACKEKEVPWIEALQISHFGESLKDVVKLLQAIDQDDNIKNVETVKQNALTYLMDVHGTGNSRIIEAEAEGYLEKWLKDTLCTLAQFFPNLEEAKIRLQTELGRSGMLIPNSKWPLSRIEKRKEILAGFVREAKIDVRKTNPNSSLKGNCNSMRKLANEMGIWVVILDGYSKRNFGMNSNILCDTILHDWVDSVIYDIVGAAEALEV